MGGFCSRTLKDSCDPEYSIQRSPRFRKRVKNLQGLNSHTNYTGEEQFSSYSDQERRLTGQKEPKKLRIGYHKYFDNPGQGNRADVNQSSSELNPQNLRDPQTPY